MITHYDLFAGIGGFSLALDTIFHDQKINHIFCEWEAFPAAVLRKHWPDATYYGDIADLVVDTNMLRDGDGSRKVQEAHGEIPERYDHAKPGNANLIILTGGFPCQPFSHAGRRNGTADDRYKWPEMFAVIRNVRPDWVIAENVRGLVTWNDGMVLETVCADLESEGYEVQPLIIPAVAVGAPHRRDRVWIVAHDRRKHGEQGDSKALATDQTIRATSTEANQRSSEHPWSADWREVAFATCHDGMDDGLPRRMDGATYRGKVTNELTYAQWRKESLKAYGNAIVPQAAQVIFAAIRGTIISYDMGNYDSQRGHSGC